MKKRELWITLCLVNLSIVAFLGLTLRTKYLFPLSFIDYKNFLSAHSHFGFGGWVTLSLMILYIEVFLTRDQKQKKEYQFILWGIEITSLGMLLTFPFQGYAAYSITFSTIFIFTTYWFSWTFIKDIRKLNGSMPALWLAVGALLCLVLSSAGPFTLAYILATKKGDAMLFRDALYTYLHFQYNGFFTLSVFALLFENKLRFAKTNAALKMRRFAICLCLSVVPSLFLSLLWHPNNMIIRAVAIIGCVLVLLTLFYFFRLITETKQNLILFQSPVARTLFIFSMVSFAIKMFLQSGTIIPSLGNAVFGYRPIIIGFLHLVFLGLVTFYILSSFIDTGVFSTNRISIVAIIYFSMAIILNEAILLVDGIGLMFETTSQLYGWLLWIAAICLFTGAILLLMARWHHIKTKKEAVPNPVS